MFIRGLGHRSPLLIVMLCAAPLAACATGSASAPPPVAATPVSPVFSGSPPPNPLLSSLDQEDRARAEQARQQALESGKTGVTVSWKNPADPGRFGSVSPGPKTERDGVTCRQFTQTVYIDGVPQTGRSSACRRPEGLWQVVS